MKSYELRDDVGVEDDHVRSATRAGSSRGGIFRSAPPKSRESSYKTNPRLRGEDGFKGIPTPIKYTAQDGNKEKAAQPGYILASYPVEQNAFLVPSDAKTAVYDEPVEFELDASIDAETVKLIDAAGNKVDTVTVPNKGTWTIDKANRKVVFTPEENFVGAIKPVRYTAANNSGIESTFPGFLQATLTYKDGEEPEDKIVLPSKAQRANQVGETISTTPEYQSDIDRAIVRILNGGQEVTELTVPGEGTWTVENGTFTFIPEDGFKGNPTPIKYTAKTKSGVEAASPGYIIASYPVEQNVFNVPSDAKNGKYNTPVTFDLHKAIDAQSVKFLDAQGNEVDTVTVPNQGTWTIDRGNRQVVFTPNDGFRGAVSPVRYTAKNNSGVESEFPGYFLATIMTSDKPGSNKPGPEKPGPDTSSPSGSSEEDLRKLFIGLGVTTGLVAIPALLKLIPEIPVPGSSVDPRPVPVPKPAPKPSDAPKPAPEDKPSPAPEEPGQPEVPSPAPADEPEVVGPAYSDSDSVETDYSDSDSGDLASTGANVLGTLALGALLTLAGAFLVRRRRES